MRKRITITLSRDLFVLMDQERGPKISRSAFIEQRLLDHLKKKERDHYQREERDRINTRDLEIINANADYFNREEEDLLPYQTPIDFSSEKE